MALPLLFDLKLIFLGYGGLPIGKYPQQPCGRDSCFFGIHYRNGETTGFPLEDFGPLPVILVDTQTPEKITREKYYAFKTFWKYTQSKSLPSSRRWHDGSLHYDWS